ncbi:MAG: ABC-F family ATP-binding cassette domain-containing protein [Candidatus Izemoplasmataceae bacterium]
MNILTVSKLAKTFGNDTLFEHVSFDINSKENIALIGKNGTGKSTLVKMILGEVAPDEGEIHINKKAKIGYLSQRVITDTSHTLIDEVLSVFQEALHVEQKIKDISLKMEKDPHNEQLLSTYANLEHDFESKGGYDIHYKIDMILHQFGFSREEYKRPIITFSNGEQTRIAFAKLLLQAPDLLILDEPTNHLDIRIIEWLEDYLMKYDGSVFIITHDKYFIDKVCKKILEIDVQEMQIYHGNYNQYLEQKAERFERLLTMYRRQQKEIRHLESFVERFRYNAKKATMAQDRIKKLGRIERIKEPKKTKRKLHLAFQPRRPTREVILEAKDATFGYEEPLIKHLSFTMRGFEKVAIIGPNGTGKTTLLKILQNKMSLMSGKIHFLRDYKIGYFDQNQESLSFHKTIFEEIHDLHPMFTKYDIYSIGAKFLFYHEDMDKNISVLSGGEKVRLVLLLLMLEKPDLLILDEPTNHLDIETKDIVEEVFDEFEGPIIFVSHDRYFINRIASKLIYFENQKGTVFEGNYDAYKAFYAEEKVKHFETTKKTHKSPQDSKISIAEIEKEIMTIEQKIESKKALTFESEYYLDKEKIEALNKEIESLENDLLKLDEKYYKLLEMD